MPKNTTAGTYVSKGQLLFLCITLFLTAVFAFFSPLWTAWTAVAITLIFIFVFVIVKFELVRAARRYKHHPYYAVGEDHTDLPVYTIFAPMFDEPEGLPSLIEGISKFRYDKTKLQVLLLLEDRSVDKATWAVLDSLDLPDYIEPIELPIRKIRNKPTALNVGLKYARGEFAVIYDAEDRPDPDQLLKAVGTFWHADENLACLQARLRFSNETDSAISRGLQIEYDIHFRQLLPGLAYHGLVPPLGGTSNHFRISALHAIASIERLTPELRAVGAIGGWDSWNSTEDAELAGRFYEMGFHIEMLDSVTYEVATTTLKTVILQRSRWQKGYVQTWLTYTRNIRHHIHEMGFKRWLFFAVFLTGTTQTIPLSTVTWIGTIVYFTARPTWIETLFPWPLMYLGAFLLIAGNFAIWVQHITAAVTHCKPSSAIYTLLLLVWQQLATLSHLIAIYELSIPSKRYDWRKTPHEGNFASLQQIAEEEGVSSNQEAITEEFPAIQPASAMQKWRVPESDAV